MSMMLPVSFKECEKNLFDWVQQHKNEFGFSDVCKAALIEKKKEFDIIHSENPKTLHERISDLKEQIARVTMFLESDKNAQNNYFKFMESHPLKKTKNEIQSSTDDTIPN